MYKELTYDQQNKADKCSEFIAADNAPLQALRISGAVTLGNFYGKSLREAGNNAAYKPEVPVGLAQGRKSGYPRDLSDHNGIGHYVKLLKNIAEHQGKGKKENKFCRISLSHSRFFCMHFYSPVKTRGASPPKQAIFSYNKFVSEQVCTPRQASW